MAVVMGFSGGAYADVKVVVGAMPLDVETVRPVDIGVTEDTNAAAEEVGAATGPVPAAGAVPREGVAWQVADKDKSKLFKPSGCKGSEGPAGRVPT